MSEPQRIFYKPNADQPDLSMMADPKFKRVPKAVPPGALHPNLVHRLPRIDTKSLLRMYRGADAQLLMRDFENIGSSGLYSELPRGVENVDSFEASTVHTRGRSGEIILEGINVHKPNFRKHELLDAVIRYALVVRSKYRMNLTRIMFQYAQANPQFSLEIIRKMQDRKYDLPIITIFDTDPGNDFLQETLAQDLSSMNRKPFRYSLNDEMLLFNFELPLPLARMWHRRNTIDKRRNIRPEGAIEWGELYSQSRKAVYECNSNADEKFGLKLQRINPESVHNPRKYYYLYSMSLLTDVRK